MTRDCPASTLAQMSCLCDGLTPVQYLETQAAPRTRTEPVDSKLNTVLRRLKERLMGRDLSSIAKRNVTRVVTRDDGMWRRFARFRAQASISHPYQATNDLQHYGRSELGRLSPCADPNRKCTDSALNTTLEGSSLRFACVAEPCFYYCTIHLSDLQLPLIPLWDLCR